VSTVAPPIEAYRARFDRLSTTRFADEPEWLRSRREAALARAASAGFPGARDEAWRHTPTAPLERRFEAPADGEEAGTATPLPLREMEGPRVVFVNGRLAPGLSSRADHPGLEVTSLRQLLRHDPPSLEPYLLRVAGEAGGMFADLNAALAEDGAVVRVAASARPGPPVHVVHLVAGEGPPPGVFARTLLLAGAGSETSVVESFMGPAGRPYLHDAVTEVVVEANASVDHYKVQIEGDEGAHVARLAVRLERDARFCDHALSLGAGLARNDIDVLFGGEGGECSLDGLFVTDARRTSDTHTRVDHALPHCASRELYKGVLDGRSRGVFHGLVLVRPGAQKTDAAQMNKNLLLSREALVHSTPQLEILADDVKCKHGSTTGQLDPAAMFYLRSRGIGEAAARGLLTWAFASEIAQRMRISAPRRLVEQRLRGALAGAAFEEALS
jgi:Fe-S cluster assembly protein SufD